MPLADRTSRVPSQKRRFHARNAQNPPVSAQRPWPAFDPCEGHLGPCQLRRADALVPNPVLKAVLKLDWLDKQQGAPMPSLYQNLALVSSLFQVLANCSCLAWLAQADRGTDCTAGSHAPSAFQERAGIFQGLLRSRN